MKLLQLDINFLITVRLSRRTSFVVGLSPGEFRFRLSCGCVRRRCEYESKFKAEAVGTVQVQRVGTLQVRPGGLQALNLFFGFVVRGHAVVLVGTAYGGYLPYDEVVDGRVECKARAKQGVSKHPPRPRVITSPRCSAAWFFGGSKSPMKSHIQNLRRGQMENLQVIPMIPSLVSATFEGHCVLTFLFAVYPYLTWDSAAVVRQNLIVTLDPSSRCVCEPYEAPHVVRMQFVHVTSPHFML